MAGAPGRQPTLNSKTSGEGSWHRRARRARQAARGTLAVRRAQLLLQRHHGGGGGAMPRDDGGGHFNQPAVLHGPKKPEWGCSKCGFAYNWASRLSCKECGNCAAAYTKDRAQARQSESRARWSEQRDGRETGRNAGGRTSGGTGGSVANGKLKALQAEVEQLRRKLATQPCSSQEATDDDGEGQSSPSIAALVAAYEAVRSLGEKDPLTKMAKERLDEGRTKRDLGKAAPVRVREAERLAAKRKKDHESAQRTVQDAKNDRCGSGRAGRGEVRERLGGGRRGAAERKGVRSQRGRR